ncbi:hypothetical protein [Kitasatospora albolonga]|uniref:hypothetical protein n=1 Tax=Kitasatospora albolonga TaxID=68173 RepID=UPI0035E48D0C
MIDATNVPGAPGWWDGIRSIPAGRWGLLLAVHAVAAFLASAVYLGQSFAAALLLGGLVAAGAWYAVLRILRPGSEAPPAPGRLPLLWAWLVLLDLPGLLDALRDLDGVTVSAQLRALASLVDLGLRYLFALLPVVLLLEGRSPLRAVRLLHRSRRTVVPVAAVVVLGFVAEQVFQYVLFASTLDAAPGEFAPQLTGTLLFAAVRGALTTATLYVTYRLATAEEPQPV